MEFECLKVIEAAVAKLAARMIENYFSSLADISLLEMDLQLAIREQTLFGYDAAAVIEADITEL